MGWMTIKGIGVWGDEPQDLVGDAIEKLLKKMPKRLSINDVARMKRMLVTDSDLKAKCDKAYLREWNRPMNRRELSHHIETGLSTAFCHPDLYGRNPVYLKRLEGSENWNKQRAWAYNQGFMDARNGYRNGKKQYLLGTAYDLGYQLGKRGLRNPMSSFPSISETYYILLTNLYLDIQAGRKPMSRGNYNLLMSYLDGAHSPGDQRIREWWYEEFQKLPGWLNVNPVHPFICGQCGLRFPTMEKLNKHLKRYHPEAYASYGRNPIVGTVGLGLLSGVGLGVGFSIVNWGKKKLLQKNPGQQLVFHKGTKKDGCRKVILPGEQVANRWGRILCSKCDAGRKAPSLAVYSVGILRPEIFQALGRRKLQCGDTLISRK